jgi:hypothetical protein
VGVVVVGHVVDPLPVDVGPRCLRSLRKKEQLNFGSWGSGQEQLTLYGLRAGLFERKDAIEGE